MTATVSSGSRSSTCSIEKLQNSKRDDVRPLGSQIRIVSSAVSVNLPCISSFVFPRSAASRVAPQKWHVSCFNSPPMRHVNPAFLGDLHSYWLRTVPNPWQETGAAMDRRYRAPRLLKQASHVQAAGSHKSHAQQKEGDLATQWPLVAVALLRKCHMF